MFPLLGDAAQLTPEMDDVSATLAGRCELLNYMTENRSGSGNKVNYMEGQEFNTEQIFSH